MLRSLISAIKHNIKRRGFIGVNRILFVRKFGYIIIAIVMQVNRILLHS